MAKTAECFVNRIKAGVYNKNQIKALRTQFIADGKMDYVKAIDEIPVSDLPKNLQPKTTLTTPPKERITVLDEEECVNESFDLKIARKLLDLSNRSKKKGLEFNLSLSDIKNLLNKKTCYYSGVKFDDTKEHLSRSIDRVNDKIGYVKGNVVACTRKMNQIKSILFEGGNSPEYTTTVKELSKMLARLEE
jgi:hypothetical protein